MRFEHYTVMCAETLALVKPRSGGVYVDVTAGGGGHSEAILEASGPDGFLLAMDRDLRAVEATRERLAPFGDRAVVVHGRFGELSEVLGDHGIGGVDGLVADLGVSSPQLDDPTRGFSFREAGPLDMRMDTSRGETALELIQRLSASELADAIYEYGEERRSRRIAQSIKEAEAAGELQTTGDLRHAVYRVMGRGKGRIDPATRTFQGIRIALNRELDELETLLGSLPDVLGDEGVAAIISFHSLEDRMVKWAFRRSEDLSPLTKKPIIAGESETAENRRSRSAKLRGARRHPREEAQ